MNIFFWQNIISPHQVDFLKALSVHYKITLIVERVQDAERKKDGWEIPQYDYLEIIIAPELHLLNQYFTDLNDMHVFSGISAYQTVYKGFKKAVHLNAKIGIFSEPIQLDGLKGFLKLMRGHYQRIRYGNNIKFIAATGDLGIETYKKFGYKNDKLLHWGYFVDHVFDSVTCKNNKIIYVGNLNENKQIKPLVKLFLESNYNYDGFDIIGSGPLENEIKALIKDNKEITLHGRLKNQETMQKVAHSKLLILPSLEDGWGVVVNEALLAGTPVITSDNVGAKILIENSDRGEVFKAGNYDELKRLIEKWLNKNYEENDYLKIQKWAVDKITPDSAANYFTEIIFYAFAPKEKKIKPTAPWLKKDIK